MNIIINTKQKQNFVPCDIKKQKIIQLKRQQQKHEIFKRQFKELKFTYQAAIQDQVQEAQQISDSVVLKENIQNQLQQSILTASRDIDKEQIIYEISSNDAISVLDARQDETIRNLAEGQGEVIGLALWLMSQKQKGQNSQYKGLVESLPKTTESPMLWPDEQAEDYLKGSQLLQKVQSRKQALKEEWQQIEKKCQSMDIQLSQDIFNESAFIENVQIILASTSYLPTLQCLAILPQVFKFQRQAKSGNCKVDYDEETEDVVIKTDKPYKKGDQIFLQTELPNQDLLLNYGYMQDDNEFDCIEYRTSLVKIDRLYKIKLEILQNEGYGDNEIFPLYMDKQQLQLYSFLRLVRVQNATQIAKVNFQKDVILDQMNEYEVLQLVLSDFRTMLGNQKQTQDDDYRALNRPEELSPRELISIKQTLNEKLILNKNIEMVRTRLAPIRGVPTKAGQMQDPNADILDIFRDIEDLPNKPKKLIDGFFKWARGENDDNKKEYR